MEGLQRHIRYCVDLAKRFEKHIKEDPREMFELVVPRSLALVCFRLKVLLMWLWCSHVAMVVVVDVAFMLVMWLWWLECGYDGCDDGYVAMVVVTWL